MQIYDVHVLNTKCYSSRKGHAKLKNRIDVHEFSFPIVVYVELVKLPIGSCPLFSLNFNLGNKAPTLLPRLFTTSHWYRRRGFYSRGFELFFHSPQDKIAVIVSLIEKPQVLFYNLFTPSQSPKVKALQYYNKFWVELKLCISVKGYLVTHMKAQK